MAGSGDWRRWRELALVVFGVAAATVLLTHPLARHMASTGRVDNADARFLIWNVAWVARTLAIDPWHVLDANIFYPHRGTLAYSETNLGAGLLAMPVYWATRNPYAAYNFVTLASFALSGTATYYLVRHLVEDRRAAAVSAACFAFCPYVFGRLPHIHLLMTAGLPASLLALHRLADRPGARAGVVLGVAMAAQSLFCGYYGVFGVLIVGYMVLAMAALGWWRRRDYWQAVAVAAAVAIALAVPLFLPYLRLQRGAGFARSVDEARLWAADWRSYLASSATAHAWMLGLIGRWVDILFPGFVATLAGVAGAFAGWRRGGRLREVAVLYSGLVTLAAWASLGPDAGLYEVLHATVPAFSFLRTPSRFGVLVSLGLSVLAGAAIAAYLRGRDNGLQPTGPRSRSGLMTGRNLAAAVLVLAVLAESRVPLGFAPAPPVEPAYRMLATLPPGPVLDIPVYSYPFAHERTRYMLGSTTHWMPLVVGYSSYTPPDFYPRVEVLAGFPTREALALMEREGIRYVAIHMHLFSDDMRRGVAERLQAFRTSLARRYADDRVWLYEVVSFPR
ncbi:MAG: hypothetical protein AB7I13_15530 [Vicinamibacterales bacterium]